MRLRVETEDLNPALRNVVQESSLKVSGLSKKGKFPNTNFSKQSLLKNQL